MTVKAAAELGLQRWARVAVRRRWTIIVLMSALALGFGSQLPKLRAETSSESYLKPDDPGRILYDRFREQFGRDTKIAIGIDPPEVFSVAFLERLKEFHETIENEVPLLVEVTSLINIRNTRGEGDRLIVEDLLEDFPQSQEEVDRLEARVMANPLYQDFLISRDVCNATTISAFSSPVRKGGASGARGFRLVVEAAQGLVLGSQRRLGGSLPMEVLIETGVENGIQDPSVMNGIQAMHDRVRRYAEEGLTVGKATSIVDVVRETHKALNENRPEFYRVPQSRGVIAQELLLFENSGSDDLEEVVDSRFSLARLTIRMPDGDAADRRELIEEASIELPRALDGHARVTLTDLSVLMNRTMDAVIYSLSRSYILALILITPLMMWFIGSLRRGLVSMVPNLLPILLCLGFMGWAGIPLDIFTLLIGCIAIGLAVDDTIHFIHGFQGRWLEHGDPALAISETLQTTGKALLFTSVVLSAGFFIFMLSSLKNLVSFGLLTGFVILMAFIADITVTPALLTLVSKNSGSRRSGGG